ncbi:MAG: hypothetical protein ACTSXO_01505 [Candidatus Heimdallarchaeota archaeon]
MKNKKAFIISVAAFLTFAIVLQSMSIVSSIPQLDTVILYMAPDKLEPIIGDNVTTTVVFKNYLDVDYDMYNVSLTITSSGKINITNVNDTPFEDPTYNKTDLFITSNNSIPIFFWNNTYIEVAWAVYERNLSQTFWFVFYCYEVGTFRFENPELTYHDDSGQEYTFSGSGLSGDVRAPKNVSSVPVPYRGDWEWYWWFSGALLIVGPLIAIVIIRLTLWKR